MKKKILLIEDDEAISDMIGINLENAGYEYEAIFDGKDAEEVIKQTNKDIDLILLDIMLPNRDGFQLLKDIRVRNIATICLTAVSDIDSRIFGLQNGAEDYMVKPFDIRELMVRIKKILDRHNTDKNVRIGDVWIYRCEHKVIKDGKIISLKPKEYDLLLFLYDHNGNVIDRERILNEVWGEEYVGESRTVDVHIGQIRKKLGLGEYIRTIPKVGYLLEEKYEDTK